MLVFFSNSWIGYCLALFFLTFAHEDVAIVAAAFAHVEYDLPLLWAGLSVYAGIVISDLSIYALGRLAQRNAWLRSRIIGPRIDNAKIWLNEHLMRSVAMCRLTPGLLFPTYVACGWFRLSFGKFALASALSAVIYTPIALTLVVLFGATVLQRMGEWAWAVVLLLVIILIVHNVRKPSQVKSNKSYRTAILDVIRNCWNGKKDHYRGMPALDPDARVVSIAERLPDFLFYMPIALRWFWLSLRYRSLTLPTAANPSIENGGFWGESKDACMKLVGAEQQRWIAPYIAIEPEQWQRDAGAQVLARVQAAGIEFPLVAKPDIGWQGYGVRLVLDQAQLAAYIDDFPRGERLLLQAAVPHDGEAGVFYARLPGEPVGRVFSLTLRYFPHVIGDGVATLRELILHSRRTRWKADHYLGERSEHLGLGREDLDRVPDNGELVRLAFIGSIRIGGLYRDARQLITPELSQRFDAIAQSMPEFYYGRFDIRFKSIERLQAGEDFRIIEVNGAGSEAIHAWDPQVPLRRAYHELFEAQSLMFEIAARNRASGFAPTGVRAFLGAAIRQHRLLKHYPAAD